jgi:starch synthase
VKIALIAAETGPHAKAGGLADVIAALPRALRRAGAETCVIAPAYRSLLTHVHAEGGAESMEVAIGGRREPFRVLAAESGGVALRLIDHPGFFDRAGIYGENGAEYTDNNRRFVFFGRAAAMAAARLDADVIHAHDWHAALASIVMRADPAMRPRFARATSVFTIHNLAFQGLLDPADFSLLGLDPSWYSIECLEFYGRVNLMKGAIVLADGVSTVSPGYADEISRDSEFGFGMEGVLRAKGARFRGILNGADYDEWNPAHDDRIAARFTPTDRDGKRQCRRDLRERLELPQSDQVPLIGMVSRMTPQKGFDLLASALDQLMALDIQLVMLASGDPGLERLFAGAQYRYPRGLRVLTAFDSAMAHRIQAGADMFLMPSRFEPCGLTQMYALKYGTVPIVRATGGLKDTVAQFDPASCTGNGFLFSQYRPEPLIAAIRNAANAFTDQKVWARLMDNCFAADFSWAHTADEYLAWFARLRGERAGA